MVGSGEILVFRLWVLLSGKQSGISILWSLAPCLFYPVISDHSFSFFNAPWSSLVELLAVSRILPFDCPAICISIVHLLRAHNALSYFDFIFFLPLFLRFSRYCFTAPFISYMYTSFSRIFFFIKNIKHHIYSYNIFFTSNSFLPLKPFSCLEYLFFPSV